MAEAYVVAALRTAGGRRGGRLSGWHPADLGAAVVDALVEKTGIDPASVEDVITGCVTPIGEQAFNLARQVVLSSKYLPDSVPGVTIDRQCGSSQQAIAFAAQAIMAGASDVVIAAGVESMSRAPMNSAYTFAAEKGIGGPVSSGMERKWPGFEFNQFRGAEMMAQKYGLTKDDLDRFALASHQKAAAATRDGGFKDEIVPVQVTLKDGSSATHDVDEGIRFETSLEAIQGVKVLQEGGMVTAASSSQICDGASAVLVVSEAVLKAQKLKPMARIVHTSALGSDPVIMLETPIPATERALKKAGLSIGDIDLYEVNEAFASVPLAWTKALGADPERLNVHGGAIALGHPLGCSGAKLTSTLLNALRQKGKRYGLQTMCEGGGLANVTIYENLA
jgi:acetyl-CoA C-acetyltransferase